MRRRRSGHHDVVPSDPLAAWSAWVSDNMQQQERALSPHEKSAPSALILVPLLGLPALLLIGMLLAVLLG